MGASGENLLGNKLTNILVHLQTNMYMYLYIITPKTPIMITHHAFHTAHQLDGSFRKYVLNASSFSNSAI